MLNLIRKLFAPRSGGLDLRRDRRAGLGSMFGGRRHRTAFGALASMLAPYLLRRLTVRRSQRPGLFAR